MSQGIIREIKALRGSIERLRGEIQEGFARSFQRNKAGPAWKPGEEDTTCDLTGSPVPRTKRLPLQIGKERLYVHPGVVRYAEKAPGVKITRRTKIPAEYLGIPTWRIKRRGAGLREDWTADDLYSLARPQLYQAAKDVGLKGACDDASQGDVGIDYRRESNEWLIEAITRVLEGKPIPAPEHDDNVPLYRAAPRRGRPPGSKNKPKPERIGKKAAKKGAKRTAKQGASPTMPGKRRGRPPGSKNKPKTDKPLPKAAKRGAAVVAIASKRAVSKGGRVQAAA